MSDIIKDDTRFIHGEDLQKNGKWCDVTLTIKEVGEADSMRSKGGQTIAGYPFKFVETNKMAVFKGNNLRLLRAALMTKNRSEMVGKRLTLYPAIGDWFRQSGVVAVRIRVPEGRGKPFIPIQNLGRDLTKGTA